MQAEAQMASPKTRLPEGGLILEYVETALIRFILGTPEEVLPGIPKIVRDGQKKLDLKHLTELEQEEEDVRVAARKAVRGRVRPGHFDTGFEVYHQEESVSVPTLAEGLMRNGYGFRDVHFFEQGKGRRLYVVVFALEYGKPNAENTTELNRMYAHYAAHSYNASVWDNPNLTATINLTDRLRARTVRKLVVAGRKRICIV